VVCTRYGIDNCKLCLDAVESLATQCRKTRDQPSDLHKSMAAFGKVMWAERLRYDDRIASNWCYIEWTLTFGIHWIWNFQWHVFMPFIHKVTSKLGMLADFATTEDFKKSTMLWLHNEEVRKSVFMITVSVFLRRNPKSVFLKFLTQRFLFWSESLTARANKCAETDGCC